MSVTLVQSNKASNTTSVPQAFGGGGTITISLACAFTSNVTAGDVIIVLASGNVPVGGSSVFSPAISDSQGNTYTQALWINGAFLGQEPMGIFFATAATTGACTVTFSCSASNGDTFNARNFDLTMAVMEWSGYNTPALQGQNSVQQGTATNTMSLIVTASDSTAVTTAAGGSTTQGVMGVADIASTAPILADVFVMLSNVAPGSGPVVSPGGYMAYQLVQTVTSPNGYVMYAYSRTSPVPTTTLLPSISASPDVGTQGTTTTITVTGTYTHFVGGTTTVGLSGTGATITSVSVASSTSLTFSLALTGSAPIGLRTLTVTTGGEVVSTTFAVASGVGPPAIVTDNIAWSQLRLGNDGRSGTGSYGQSCDGAIGTPGNAPVYMADGKTLTPGGASPGGGGGIIAFYNGSGSSFSLGSAPTSFTAIDSMTITLSGSGSARQVMICAMVTWASATHGMRGVVLLDGSVNFPAAYASSNPGFNPNTNGDGLYWLQCSGVVVSVPGDSASHTIALSWQAQTATTGFTLYDRWISGVVIG